MRRTLKRLASGKLGSTKGRDGASSVDGPPLDPSYVVVESAAGEEASAQETIAELR